MGRRIREDDNAVSLFPFLSILACVIGVLTLMIMAVALGQLDPEAVAEAERELAEAEERAAEHEQVTETIATLSTQRSDLEKLIAEAEAVRQELERARAELAKLEAEREKAPTDQASAAVLAEMNRLRERIATLEEDLPAISAEIEKLKAQLAQMDKEPPPAQVQIKPGGSGATIDPLFIECRGSGVVVLDGSNKTVHRNSLTDDPDFAAAMAKVRERENGVMIFLVRPDGVWTYNRASDVARINQTRNGKLPVSGQGEIDLSLFK